MPCTALYVSSETGAKGPSRKYLAQLDLKRYIATIYLSCLGACPKLGPITYKIDTLISIRSLFDMMVETLSETVFTGPNFVEHIILTMVAFGRIYFN
jgi:hypothetical protein